jgi:hypothetical protein
MLEKSPRPPQKIIRSLAFLLVLLSLGLVGCSNLIDFENNQVLTQDEVGSFGAGATLGQSFLIRRQPLTGIQLWLRGSDPGELSAAPIIITLSATDDPTTILYSGQISRQQLARSYPILIKIPPLSLEIGKKYQFDLSTNSGVLSAYGKGEDIYPYGNAFSSTTTLDSDLAFRLEYGYSYSAMLEDIDTILSLSIPIIFILLIMVMPGWPFR